MVDPNTILQRYPWYIPAHITLWQQEGVGSEITQVIAMNYTDALVQEESVDIDFLHDFSETPTAEQTEIAAAPIAHIAPIPAMIAENEDIIKKYLTVSQPATEQPISEQPLRPQMKKRVTTALQLLEDAASANTAAKRSSTSSDQIIDRFLEVKELKIVPAPYDETDDDLSWQLLDPEPLFAPEDGVVNEELAKIYLNQNHYDQAKEIYTKLYLHYSDKCRYFATQIQSVTQLKLENAAPRGKTGDKTGIKQE